MSQLGDGNLPYTEMLRIEQYTELGTYYDRIPIFNKNISSFIIVHKIRVCIRHENCDECTSCYQYRNNEGIF